MKKLALLALMLAFSKTMAQNCDVMEGYASWYGGKFHGKRTSSGEIFNKHKYTGASRKYPLGTYLLVKNLDNNEEVVVIVTDRGPWKKNRIIDLSKAAAKKLDFIKQGIAKVQVMPLYCAAKKNEFDEEGHEEVIRDILNTL
ncbi:MAG: septal ring lytic transglycosylase RlpA family protein [Aquificaceae bacterium]|nr:septal ring lytic transglycosylase RlpA family protein [Aquificaceae bacterium]